MHRKRHGKRGVNRWSGCGQQFQGDMCAFDVIFTSMHSTWGWDSSGGACGKAEREGLGVHDVMDVTSTQRNGRNVPHRHAFRT